MANERIQLAEMAQCLACDGARKTGIACFQPGACERMIECNIERAVAAQNIGKNAKRNFARRKALRLAGTLFWGSDYRPPSICAAIA